MFQKYSSLQVDDYSKGSYRVKNKDTNEWIPVQRKNGKWFFLNQEFSTANKLNNYLKMEGGNKMVNDTMILFEDKKMDPAKKGGVQWHGGPGSKEYQKDIINNFLVGNIVRVYWSMEGHTLSNDHGFIPSICIKGKLENIKNWYRVLIENDTYCYFDFERILSVAIRAKDSGRFNSISLKSNKNH